MSRRDALRPFRAEKNRATEEGVAKCGCGSRENIKDFYFMQNGAFLEVRVSTEKEQKGAFWGSGNVPYFNLG